MMLFQQEQLMVSLHKLPVQQLQLMQAARIHLQQQLRVLIHIQYQYVRQVKQQIVLPKL